MEFLESLLATSGFPLITAFLLGIVTSLHPCPLMLNITAIGYICNDLKEKRRAVYNGLLYTLGRVFTYTLLASLVLLGADALHISAIFQTHSELWAGIFLIVLGILMLDILPFNLPLSSKITAFFNKKIKDKKYSSFLLGAAFALVFCPHTVVFFFGILTPLIIATPEGMFLPITYAIGTGLPVVLAALILTFGMANISLFFNNIKIIERWIRIISAIIFIFAGIYLIIE
ncbi:MAG: aromatic aminobenezylarsenical efflux permease ArsG family transporter [Prevotellaceae bacterium]|jgi:cytochrome c biogenesis protein CcdA|nr:aromatic aminobenezylarsenical efflux permease ArsG family transporter [Prevotellaceae bacterium]